MRKTLLVLVLIFSMNISAQESECTCKDKCDSEFFEQEPIYDYEFSDVNWWGIMFPWIN